MKRLTLAAAAVLLAAPALAQTATRSDPVPTTPRTVNPADPAANLGGGATSGTQQFVPQSQQGGVASSKGGPNSVDRDPVPTTPSTVNRADPAVNLGGGRTSGTNQFVPPSQRGGVATSKGGPSSVDRDPVPTTGSTVNPADPAANLGGGATSGTQRFVPQSQQGGGATSKGGPNQ